MKQVTIEVKNCRNCCFAEAYFNNDIEKKIGVVSSASCLAPYPLVSAGSIDGYYIHYKTSPNCPLKKQSLKIEFKK